MIPLAALAASALITATWQGLLLAAAVLLCLRLAPALSAAARSLIWSAAFALLLLLHFAPHAPAPAGALHLDPRWSLALLILWAACSLFRALQLARSALFLRRLARGAKPIATPALLAQSPRPAQLCTSPEIDRPSLVGFFSPRILLPLGLLETLTPDQLEPVLLHELEHLRRRDDWTNLLQKLALVLFPLNPVLLWVERRLCTERELACDDRVLRTTAAPKAYATCLVHLAEHTLLRRGLTLALGALGAATLLQRPSELTRRVTRILSRPAHALTPRQTLALVATLLLTLSAATLKLARTPELVSFLPSAPAASLAATSAPAAVARPANLFLTKAVVPATPTHNPHLRATQLRTTQLRTTQLRTARRVAPPQRWFLLTNLQQPRSYPPTQARLTLVSANTFSYAAVPTPNGWILIPLQPRILNLEL